MKQGNHLGICKKIVNKTTTEHTKQNLESIENVIKKLHIFYTEQTLRY